MWNVLPSMMCDKHLLGEHVEMHMLLGCMKAVMEGRMKQSVIDGFVRDGFVDVAEVITRHDRLVEEMEIRDMNHTSPVDGLRELHSYYMVAYLNDGGKVGMIDVGFNLSDLRNRCVRCRTRQEGLEIGLL